MTDDDLPSTAAQTIKAVQETVPDGLDVRPRSGRAIFSARPRRLDAADEASTPPGLISQNYASRCFKSRLRVD